VDASTETTLEVDAGEPTEDAALGLCPVDRLPKRRRNQLCIAIIAIGALNFLIYTITYAVVGGDAHNGEARLVERSDGRTETAFFVRGHFIHSLRGKETEVSRRLWVYSYLHSMSVFVTSAAMIISMLVLARPHILATMRGGWISGRVFVAAFGTAVVVIASAAIIVFAWDFVVQLNLQ
jgi:hypothetical protein